jgi:hypothetical protein
MLTALNMKVHTHRRGGKCDHVDLAVCYWPFMNDCAKSKKERGNTISILAIVFLSTAWFVEHTYHGDVQQAGCGYK